MSAAGLVTLQSITAYVQEIKECQSRDMIIAKKSAFDAMRDSIKDLLGAAGRVRDDIHKVARIRGKKRKATFASLVGLS